eukprot:SAG22_NODE_748_length_7489_cov_39.991070_1_plen_492_part_00
MQIRTLPASRHGGHRDGLFLPSTLLMGRKPGRRPGSAAGADGGAVETLSKCWHSHRKNVQGLAIAATVVAAAYLLGPGPTGTGGRYSSGLRYHGDYTDLRTATGAKGRLAQRNQDLALALAKSDPTGECARRAEDQEAQSVALFVEGCRVDGLSFCGTYRSYDFETDEDGVRRKRMLSSTSEGAPSGRFPRYVNKHGRQLYRSTRLNFWVLARVFTPDEPLDEADDGLLGASDLYGLAAGESDRDDPLLVFESHSAAPSCGVPLGSYPWWWTAPPRGGGRGPRGGEMQLEQQYLTVSALTSEEEVGRFEAYAEEQLELELEAGGDEASLVSSGASVDLEHYEDVDLGGPRVAVIEVPADAAGCDLLRLTFVSGAIKEFQIPGMVPGQLLYIHHPMTVEDAGDERLSKEAWQQRGSHPADWERSRSDLEAPPLLRCGVGGLLKCHGRLAHNRKVVRLAKETTKPAAARAAVGLGVAEARQHGNGGGAANLVF